MATRRSYLIRIRTANKRRLVDEQLALRACVSGHKPSAHRIANFLIDTTAVFSIASVMAAFAFVDKFAPTHGARRVRIHRFEAFEALAAERTKTRAYSTFCDAH